VTNAINFSTQNAKLGMLCSIRQLYVCSVGGVCRLPSLDLTVCLVRPSLRSREKILVPSSKPYITLQGAGWNSTILQWNDTADTVAENGEKLGTYWSASVAVEAKYFIARNMAFKVS